MLEAAKAAGVSAGERAQERLAGELELVPAKERKRYEREGLDARRRGERRARTQALEEMLSLAELWLRDVLCVCEGRRSSSTPWTAVRSSSRMRAIAMAGRCERRSSWCRTRACACR